MSNNNIVNILLILTSIFCSSTAQILLKVGINQIGNKITNISEFLIKAAFTPHVIAGISLYISALLFWVLALRRVDVSYAYPFTSLGFVLVLLLSSIWLQESLNLDRIIGIIFILIGIIYIARS